MCAGKKMLVRYLKIKPSFLFR